MIKFFTSFLLIILAPSLLFSENNLIINFNNGSSESYQISDIKEMRIAEDNVNVQGVSLNSEQIEIKVNDTYQAEYSISPSNATNQSVNWSSGNTAIATVSENGIITGISDGETFITVETVDGNFTDNMNVTVTPITSVESLENKIKIYPNPVQNILFIETADVLNFNVKISDINGNIIFSGSEINSIDFSDFSAGTYFLTLISDEKNYNYRIIKK